MNYHNAIQFYSLRTQVSWTKKLQLASSLINIHLIKKYIVHIREKLD